MNDAAEERLFEAVELAGLGFREGMELVDRFRLARVRVLERPLALSAPPSVPASEGNEAGIETRTGTDGTPPTTEEAAKPKLWPETVQEINAAKAKRKYGKPVRKAMARPADKMCPTCGKVGDPRGFRGGQCRACLKADVKPGTVKAKMVAEAKGNQIPLTPPFSKGDAGEGAAPKKKVGRPRKKRDDEYALPSRKCGLCGVKRSLKEFKAGGLVCRFCEE